jgi:hypothetical protein
MSGGVCNRLFSDPPADKSFADENFDTHGGRSDVSAMPGCARTGIRFECATDRFISRSTEPDRSYQL